MSSWTERDALNYRSNLIQGLELISNRADLARQDSLADIPHRLEQIERAVVVTSQEMPCEAGVIEYGEGNHDDCHDDCISEWTLQEEYISRETVADEYVEMEYVLLTTDSDPHDHEFVSMNEVAEWLESVLAAPPARAIQGMQNRLAGLNNGRWEHDLLEPARRITQESPEQWPDHGAADTF